MSESKCLVMPDDYRVHFEGVAPAHTPEPERPKLPPFAGATFGGFIDACRRLGLRDRDALVSIEFGVTAAGTRCLTLTETEQGYEVREKL